MARRQDRNRELEQGAEVMGDPTLIQDKFPAQLTRRYTLVFKPRSSTSEGPLKAL